MRTPLFLTVSLLLLASCSDQSAELNNLRRENASLQKEIFALRMKTEDAIIIPRKHIHRYINGITFGPATTKTNETFQFETHLCLAKLPENIGVEWDSKPEPMALKSDGMVYRLKNMYPTAGKRTFTGTYTLTFPNGKTEEFTWLRECEVEK